MSTISGWWLGFISEGSKKNLGELPWAKRGRNEVDSGEVVGLNKSNKIKNGLLFD